MKKLYLQAITKAAYLLIVLLVISQKSYSQCGFAAGLGCPATDYSNYGFNSTANAATLEYDNFTSAFHATIIRNSDGKFQIWGEQVAADGTSPLLVPTEINSTNFPGLTGTPIKAAIASLAANHQVALLTTDGLFVWGSKNIIFDITIKNNTAFGKIVVKGKLDGLPDGVSPADVKMMFATTGALGIVTCDGSVYVLAKDYASMTGNPDPFYVDRWFQVKKDDNNFLTNVIALRGTPRALMALTTNNEVYTWGENTLLGNETKYKVLTRNYATLMSLPAASQIKMIGATSWDKNFEDKKKKDNAGDPTYYILYVDGSVYAMGNNELNQLGDFTTSNSPSSGSRQWVQPKYPNASGGAGVAMTDVKWISPNAHDQRWPAINILNNNGRLWNWGSNAGSMLGRTSVGQDKNDKTSFNPGQPLSNAAFNPLTSKVITVETGGHTTMIIQECQENFGYVGHAIHGSTAAGLDGDTYYPEFIFNTATIKVCGTDATPQISFAMEPLTGENKDVLCKEQLIKLVGTPAGGTFSIVSGPGQISADNILSFTGSDPTGTVVVRYSVATSTCSNTIVEKSIQFGPCTTYKISGWVWIDTNRDAVKDPGEVGYNPGNVLWANLLDPSGKVIMSVPVAPNGYYELLSLNNGTYSIQITNVQVGVGISVPAYVKTLPAGWNYTGHNDGSPCVVPSCSNPDLIVGVVVNNSNKTDLDFGIIQKYKVSGTVFHDANGLNGSPQAVDGFPVFTPGSGYEAPTLPPLYVGAINASGKVVQFVPVKSDGTYEIYLLTNENLTLELSTTLPVIGSSPVARTLPANWYYVGESFGINNAAGTGINDGTGVGNNAPATRYDGRIAVAFSGSNSLVSEVDFGIEIAPVADPKEYLVANTDFSPGAPSGYPSVPNFKYIPMSSAKLVDNYSTNGSLTGTDAEDCATAKSCNGNPFGTKATFTIGVINSNTRLYYDFGGGTGVQEVKANTVIKNFDITKMIIYGEVGQGNYGNELGFLYSITDKAGIASPMVTYVIRTVTILPLKLLSFEANKKDYSVDLEWVTTVGNDSKGFEIERSNDATNWALLGFNSINQSGNNNPDKVNYRFTDSSPLAGRNYYRLKQIDLENKFEYSYIRIANFENLNKINVHPNPVTDKVNVTGLAGNETVILYDSFGKSVYRTVANVKSIIIPAAQLSTGVYTVMVIPVNGSSVSFKIIKK